MNGGIRTPNTIAGWAIWLVILLAIIGCVYVAVQAFGVPIPSWIITLGVICLVAFVVILAIRFLSSLGGGGPGVGVQLPNTIAGWAIWLVILLAIIACVYVAITAFGVTIAPWIITLFWICLAAVIIIAAITFLSRLGGRPPGSGP